MKCRVLVTADNAKMPGFVHMLCAASNRSLACCATLYTYIDAISITKPHALALCVRFTEVRQLSKAIALRLPRDVAEDGVCFGDAEAIVGVLHRWCAVHRELCEKPISRGGASNLSVRVKR